MDTILSRKYYPSVVGVLEALRLVLLLIDELLSLADRLHSLVHSSLTHSLIDSLTHSSTCTLTHTFLACLVSGVLLSLCLKVLCKGERSLVSSADLRGPNGRAIEEVTRWVSCLHRRYFLVQVHGELMVGSCGTSFSTPSVSNTPFKNTFHVYASISPSITQNDNNVNTITRVYIKTMIMMMMAVVSVRIWFSYGRANCTVFVFIDPEIAVSVEQSFV
jgi:hypothetical protein